MPRILLVSRRRPGPDLLRLIRAARGVRLIGVASVKSLRHRMRADLVMFDGAGTLDRIADAVRNIAAALPRAAIIAVAPVTTQREVLDLLRAGARGILVRPVTRFRLAAAASVLTGGGAFLCVKATRALGLQGFKIGAPVTSVTILTSRERELLSLQAHGMTYKAIATHLGLSEHTVTNHLYNVHQKLGVHSGIEALNAVFAERR